MHSTGLPELFAIVPIAVMGLLFCGVVFFGIWKFYKLLSKMNDNLVGIRRAVESASLLRL
jgi:hypothetical protein